MAESFLKGFIELYANQEKDQWGVETKPPAAGLDGEDSVSTVLGQTRLLGKKDVSCFERIYIGCR